MASTDNNSQHSLCLKSNDFWCRYQGAKAYEREEFWDVMVFGQLKVNQHLFLRNAA
jgi:hypothetical protein